MSTSAASPNDPDGPEEVTPLTVPSAVPSAVTRELRKLQPGYPALFGRVCAAAYTDERIRALWLSGSLAKGTADGGSDLDLLLAIADAGFERFAADWRGWLRCFTDPLIARELPFAPGCFTCLTSDCLRLDVVAERASEVDGSAHRHRIPVFDRDGLDAVVPAPEPAAGPDPTRIRELVDEAYRRAAIFPQAVLARKDWLLGVAGVQGQRDLLYELFVEVNRPLPPTGVKQYAAKLTAAQRAVLSSLPAVAAEPGSVVAGMRATIEAWNAHGRSAVETIGVEWPARTAEVVTRYVERGG